MKYKLIQKAKPGDSQAKKKWYATTVNQGKITIEQLSKDIAGRSSLTRGDIKNVIENLLDEIPKYLVNGSSVSLGNLGSLRLSISGEGVEDPSQYNTSKIKKTKIIFTPSSNLKKEINDIKFEKVEN